MTLRIATFNLENLDSDPKEGATLAARIELLRLQLDRLKADVICLQEVNAQEHHKRRELAALDALLSDTRYASYSHVSSQNLKGTKVSDIHNLVILSRFPISASRQIWHDLIPRPTVRLATATPSASEPHLVGWDRPVLHAELELPDGTCLHVFNVHFRAPIATPVPGQKLDASSWRSIGGWAEGFYLSSIKRAGQALEVRLALDHLFKANPSALVAVLGDYNAEEHHTPVELIRGNEENTGNGGLAMQTMIPVEHSLPETQRFTVVHQGRRLMLDHVLVSRSLLARFTRMEIHNEALQDELVGYASIEHSPESYHAPIVAEFDVSA